MGTNAGKHLFFFYYNNFVQFLPFHFLKCYKYVIKKEENDATDRENG